MKGEEAKYRPRVSPRGSGNTWGLFRIKEIKRSQTLQDQKWITEGDQKSYQIDKILPGSSRWSGVWTTVDHGLQLFQQAGWLATRESQWSRLRSGVLRISFSSPCQTVGETVGRHVFVQDRQHVQPIFVCRGQKSGRVEFVLFFKRPICGVPGIGEFTGAGTVLYYTSSAAYAYLPSSGLVILGIIPLPEGRPVSFWRLSSPKTIAFFQSFVLKMIHLRELDHNHQREEDLNIYLWVGFEKTSDSRSRGPLSRGGEPCWRHLAFLICPVAFRRNH